METSVVMLFMVVIMVGGSLFYCLCLGLFYCLDPCLYS